MGLGIILGAMLAAGKSFADSIDRDQKFSHEQDLMKQRSDLEEQRQKSIATFNNQMAVDTTNSQRQGAADRISGAQTGILQGIIAKKANDAYDYTTDDDKTPASFADLQDEDQSNLAFQPSEKDKRDAFVQAAIQTGDIDPKTAATLASRDDINQLKSENYASRTEMSQKLAEIRAQATIDSKELQLQAAKEKAASGKIDTATGRMLITSEDANIKAATSQMGMLSRQLDMVSSGPNGKSQRDMINAEMDSLKADIKASKATKDSYMSQMGLPSTSGPKSSSSSAPPSGAPDGAVQIGTSGGKPVYQTPDGKKFIKQ